MAKQSDQTRASAGHKLGQLVGDWFEQFFVLPMLQVVAERLKLYLDHRFKSRKARSEKLIWRDDDGNSVDYDFVMELGGTESQLGAPVAFLESFWRRGSRHSKDKARDDSGKLLPMRLVHPTARFLGIIAGGDFTAPARELIRSRNIDLFFVPKEKIIEAFRAVGLEIDYPDRSTEEFKNQLATRFELNMKGSDKEKAAKELCSMIGQVAVTRYADRVSAALGALPQEVRIGAMRSSKLQVFESVVDATTFLDAPDFDFSEPIESYLYEITYSDGSEFSQSIDTIAGMKDLNSKISHLVAHMESIAR